MNEENKKTSKSLHKSKKKIIISVVVILAIIIGSIFAYIVSIQKKTEKWDNKIYPNVYVENVNLSGMTKEEAIEALNKEIKEPIQNKTITVKAADQSIEIKYSDLSPEYNIDETVNEAMMYGKDLNLFGKNDLINGKDKKEFNLDFKYNEAKLNEYENKLTEMVNQKAKDATISINGSNVSVTEGQDGRAIEKDKMVALVKDAVNANPEANTVVEVPVEITKPKITKEMLSKIDGVMGSFTSSYTSSDANRSANVEIAAKTVNGTVLMPGETFSYNNTLGERTTDKGYRDGAAYVGNKVVMVTGGGICQVSTTLYRAVLKAGIMPTERHNHSMTTTYSGPSEDATVAWGSLDYQFKNPYDFPIYIQGYTSNKHVTFNIYGNVQAMDGKTYELQTVVNETLKPSVKTIEDPNLPAGQRVVEQNPVTGYKSTGYLVTYQNGKEIDKKLIGHDVYKQKDEIIKVGTKKAEQPAAPPAQTTPQTPATPENPGATGQAANHS
ncbi:VanW family protein [Clostridium sp. LIBA-8841]|uniref:VanW family protein n=1 Tax=Clostridium sp. LIBA-8841 TaxID=2987530 RepID=UPI002AC44364|nr:VanW family protein [Clostridium sp. LIBA-8841]MDZ5252209.1 VanW family protein [Clostridium sp. LIBA-8841]